MKQEILYAIVYLTGCVVGYLSWREFIKSVTGEWLTWNRNAGLFMAVFSWVVVLPSIVGYLLIKLMDMPNSDKPAKW